MNLLPDDLWMPEPNSGCYLWMGSANPDGYGTSRLNGRQLGAHRHAWIIAQGVPDAGRSVLHKCDVRCCVNPAHLFLGTQLDNMRDKVRKGRHVSHAGEKHGRAKITEQQARAIRLDPRSRREIATEYGVDRSTVSYIKSGRRWRHL